VAGEVSVDTQHRFERDLARKIHHVTDETKPIIFVDIGSMAIDEFRLAAFVSARNCLSSHWLLPFFYSFPVAR
jgi:single-stranded DNA-specific DHH superfamily exonuclease